MTAVDMSRIWGQPAAAPYPAPTVTSRDSVEAPRPAVLVRLVQDMTDAGWTVMVQYAHGSMPHGVTGAPLAAQPSWAVRAYRGPRHAVAVRRGKAWDTLYVWSDRMPHTKKSTVTAFRAWVLRDETGHIAR